MSAIRRKACPARINTRPVETSDPITHYVVVRTNLPPGVLAAQLVHAAGESSRGDLKEGTFAIVLGVPNEASLIAVRTRLSLAGVEHVTIHEPDAPYRGSLMAIGVRPALKSQVRRHLSELPLFRGSSLPESANRKPPRKRKWWFISTLRRFLGAVVKRPHAESNDLRKPGSTPGGPTKCVSSSAAERPA